MLCELLLIFSFVNHVRPPRAELVVAFDSAVFHLQAKVRVDGKDEAIKPSAGQHVSFVPDGDNNYLGLLHRFRCLVPVFRKVSAWMRTSWARDGELARKRCFGAERVMGAPSAFEEIQMSIDPRHPEELFIAFLRTRISAMAPAIGVDHSPEDH